MIPKRMFFYWSGKNLSWMRYMTLYSFKKYNPDWDIILYLSDNNNKEKTWNGIEEQDFMNYVGDNYLEKIDELGIKIEKVKLPEEYKDILKNITPVHESDLFRYYLLFKEGGFYCDMDVIFFRSMNPFYEYITSNNYNTIIHQTIYHIAIGFLGSSVDNSFYKDLFKYGIDNFKMDNYQSLGVDLIYKMFYTNRNNPFIFNNLMSKYPSLNICNLSHHLIYEYDWTKIEFCFNNQLNINDFNDASVGYHWFGGSKISQYFNNIMNENNYMNFNTTFSSLVKNII